ncbi:MAG TPA: WD40 repeat domain-containing protein, partial [Abditibacteriaceae bacterium]|nr:WD40 repeat domain-containing protein [Abditibacteriaceae bacterium]
MVGILAILFLGGAFAQEQRVADEQHPIPPPLAAHEIRRFEGHKNSVNDVALSPDGRRALSSSLEIILWDTESGTEIRRFEGQPNGAYSVAFSPDGRRALSGGFDKTVRLWDVETAKELRRFEHASHVHSVAFAPDGRRALSGDWSIVHLWDLETGSEIRRFEQPEGIPNSTVQSGDFIYSVAFAPDGRRVLSGGWEALQPGGFESTMYLWDVATGRELQRFKGHRSQIDNVAFAPDGKRILSASGDGTVRLWDAASGKELRRFPRTAASVAFSQDGELALLGGNEISVWDLATERELLRLPVDGGANSVAFSRDGSRALTAGEARVMRLWNVEVEIPLELRRFEGHTDQVLAVALAPDGNSILSGGQDNTMRLWH